MEDTMKRIEVVAAVIRAGDMIFATQRGYGEFKDRWEFPPRGEKWEFHLMSQSIKHLTFGNSGFCPPFGPLFSGDEIVST